MTLIRAAIARSWDFALAALLAVVAAINVTPENLGKVTADLVVWYGVQAAAILPAMIFAASILRPDGLSITDLNNYRGALRRQMGFWSAQLALNFLAALMLIGGEATKWNVPAPARWLATSKDYSPGFVGIAAFFGVLALARSIAFVNGVFSLLELNGEITGKAIRAREAAPSHGPSRRKAPALIDPPEGYGEIKPPMAH